MYKNTEPHFVRIRTDEYCNNKIAYDFQLYTLMWCYIVSPHSITPCSKIKTNKMHTWIVDFIFMSANRWGKKIEIKNKKQNSFGQSAQAAQPMWT